MIFGMNTGCLINRYVEPHDWAKLVGETFGLRHVQLTTEMIRPDLDWSVHKLLIGEIKQACAQYSVSIPEVFTDAFSRVNHFAHPIPEVRAHWMRWMKRACEIAVELGADSFGSHPGITTSRDAADPTRYEASTAQVVEGWQELAAFAKTLGMKSLLWEPMSIRREFGETITKAQALHRRLNDGAAIPVLMCFDVDHGDVSSTNLKDTDPYAWMETFAGDIGSIHLKQSGKNKDGHRPFIPEFNTTGRILAQDFMKAASKLTRPKRLFLELSFREREPADSLLVPQLKASIDYWRPFLK